MKLKSLIPESFNMAREPVPSSESAVKVDVDSSLQSFKDKLEQNAAREKAQTEQELSRKIKGNNITFRGSKGYKQAEKDYTIIVNDVNVEYHYEDYFIVLKDNKGNNYFVVEGYPILIQAKDEAPNTTLTQNTASPSLNSPHTVKQF